MGVGLNTIYTVFEDIGGSLDKVFGDCVCFFGNGRKGFKEDTMNILVHRVYISKIVFSGIKNV